MFFQAPPPICNTPDININFENCEFNLPIDKDKIFKIKIYLN